MAIIVLALPSIFDPAMPHNRVPSMVTGEHGQICQSVVERVEVARDHVWLVYRANDAI